MSTSVTLPVSGPWATAGFVQAYFSDMISAWFDSGGVHGDWAIPGAVQGYGDSSGMHIKVRVGNVTWLGQFGELTSEATIDIASNASGNPRIDRVVLRRDSTAHTLVLTRIAGTPGVTPVPPALTGQDMPICQVTVANGAVTIAAANVTDERPFFPLGITPTNGNVANRPQTPLIGQLIAEAGDGVTNWLGWDGGQWTGLQSDTGWANLTINTAGHWATPTDNKLRIRLVGKLVQLQGSVQKTAAGASTTLCSIGSTYIPSQYERWSSWNAGAGAMVTVTVSSSAPIIALNTAESAIGIGDGFPINHSWLVD